MAELIQIPLQIDPKVDEALRAVDKFVTDAQNGLKKLTQGTKVNVDTTAAQKAIEQLADGYSDAKAQLNDTIATQKKALAALAGAGGKGSDEFNALVASIKSAEAELDKMEQAARDVDAALAPVKNVTPMQKLTQQYAQNRQALEATVQTQKEMLKALAATGDTGSKEFQEITASVKEAQAELKRLDQSADEVERSLGNVEKTSTVGDRLAKFGLAANGIQQVAGALGEVVNVGVEFDNTLKAVGAVTGASAGVLADLGDRGRNLALTFGGSASDQLKSFQGILSKFGSDVAKSPAALSKMAESVNILAKAGGIDAAQAMDALTDTMLQMGLVTGDANVDAENSVRVIDALASSAQIGAAEIPDVAASMLQVGVAAKGAGLSVEQTAGALQVLAVGGKKGSEAGIALRNVLGLIQKASGPAEETMRKFGTSSKELGQILTTQGLDAALNKIKGGMDKLGSASERNAALMTIFGTENSAAAGILLENTGKIKEFTTGIEAAVKLGANGAAGAVQQANINMQSAGEVISRIKARVEDTFVGLTQAVGSSVTGAIGAINQLAPTLTGLAGITQLVPEGAFDKVVDKAKEFGGKASEAFSKAFEKLPLDGVKSKLGDALSKIPIDSSKLASTLSDVGAKASAGLSKAFSGLGAAAFNPITLGIAAAGVALTLFFTQTEAGQKAFEKIKEVAVKAWETIQPAIAKVGEILGEMVNVLFQVGSVIVDFVVTPFQIASEVIGAIVGGVISLFSGVSSGATAATGGISALETGLQGILKYFQTLAKGVQVFAQGFQYAKAIIFSFIQNSQSIVGAFAEFASTALNPANWFNGKASEAKDKLAASLKSAVDGAVQQTNTEIAKSNLGENLTAALSLKGSLDASGKLDELVKKFNSTTDSAEKANIAEAIKKQVPGAVQAIGTVVDETGKIVTQYKVAGEEVSKFVKAQAQTGGADLKKKQEDIAKGIEAQSAAYGESIKKKKELEAAISADTAKGRDTKELQAKYADLTKLAEEEAKKLSEKITTASAVGVDLKKLNVDPAFQAQFAAQLKEMERKATEAKIGEFISKSTEIQGNLDKQDAIGKLVKKYEAAKTDIEKKSIAKQLAADVPGLVKETIKGVDVNGELIKSYEVSTDKIKENVAASKLRFTGDLATNQSAYRKALSEEGAEYQKNIGKAKELASEIQKKKTLGLDTKALEADFAKAQTAVRGEVDKTLQLANDYGKLGLNATQAVQDLAKAFNISEEAARKMLETANKPIELKLDVAKLAADFDAVQGKLKGIAETGIKGLTENFLQAGQTKDKLSALNKQLASENDATNKAKIASEKKDLEAQLKQRSEFAKTERKEAQTASKEAFKNETALTNEKNRTDRASILKTEKDRRNAALGVLAQELESARILEADDRKRRVAELEDKTRIEREKLNLEKRFGDQSAAAQANVKKQLIEKEKQYLNEKRKLELEFLKEDVENAKKLAEERAKSSISALQSQIQKLSFQDVSTLEKRGAASEKLIQEQNALEARAYLDALPAFQKVLNAKQAALIRATGANKQSVTKELEKLRSDVVATLSDESLSESEIVQKVKVQLNTDEESAALVLQNFRLLQEKQASEEVKKRREIDERIETARIQSSLNVGQREFDLRKQQIEKQLQSELALAGSNATLIAEAQAKANIANVEALGKLRESEAASVAEREAQSRLNELNKAYAGETALFLANEEQKNTIAQQAAQVRAAIASGSLSPETKSRFSAVLEGLDAELATFRQNEQLKLDIEREFSLKRIALLQQQMKERAGVIKSGAGLEQSIYDTLYSSLTAVADSFNASRNDYDGQKVGLRRQKEEELRVSGATGKERIEILKKYRQQEKELDRKFTGGAAALAQLKEVAATSLAGFAASSNAAFTKAAASAKSFSDLGTDAFVSLGTAAAATFGQIIVSGGDVGKALGKVAFDTLQSLVPILIAQITGISLAQPDAVATFGATAVARVALLTGLLQGAISVARAALGFKKGGYTGDGEADEEAGIVHKGEFVHTQSVTRQNREAFEYLHKGKTLEEYVQNVMLPKKPDLATKGLQFAKGRSDATIMQIITMDIHAQNSAVVNAINRQTASFESHLGGVEEAMRYAGREFKSKQVMELKVVPNNESYIKEINKRARRAAIQ